MSGAAEGAAGDSLGRASAWDLAADSGAVGEAPPPGPRAWVARVLPFSAVDGPGNRAVVFLQGCDFDCAYCHNPETRARLDAAPTGGAGAPEAPRDGEAPGAPDETRRRGAAAWPRHMTVPEVMAEYARFAPFLRGLTVSGGECLLQGDFLACLLEASRAAGLPGLVDTNGSTPLEGLPRVLAAAEGFMLDLKAWDPGEHRALVGADNAAVIANLRLLAGRGALAELRTVVVPGAFDVEGTVREGARILGAAGSKARYRLIAYRPHGVRASRLAGLREPAPAFMASLARLALAEGAAEVFVG